LVNIAARYLLNFHMGYGTAIVLAYLCGMVTAFCLAKRFVFARSELHTANQFIRFGLVNLAALIQVWAVSVCLAECVFRKIGMVRHAEDLAHVIGVSVPVVTSYLGHKHFSFGNR